MSNRQSAHIPRSQLVSMLMDLRGMVMETQGLLTAKDPQWEVEANDLIAELKLAIDRTTFDVSESDLIDGGFDQYHHEHFDPRRKKS